MIVGRYTDRFDDATHGMLEGASLNAGYPFYWLKITKIEGRTLVCEAGGQVHRLKFRRTKSGDRASVVVRDMIFGDIKFPVLPFKGNEE